MSRYLQVGTVPARRHAELCAPSGRPCAEEVFSSHGPRSAASYLYHAHPFTDPIAFEPGEDARPEIAPHGPLRYRHLCTWDMPARGDPVSGRVTLLVNEDLALSLCRPLEPMAGFFYKNGDADEVLYIHEGSGHIETVFGTLRYRPGDYVVVPRGTIYRIVAEQGVPRMLVIESAGPVEAPRSYINEVGQLMDFAPYSERNIQVPQMLETHEEEGRFEVRIKARGVLTRYYYRHHPLDVVGWDGYVYPWSVNTQDLDASSLRVVSPWATIQTLEARGFVVSSLVPQSQEIMACAGTMPYHYTNLETDEVFYYSNSRFASHMGIAEGSITFHPAGLPHGIPGGSIEPTEPGARSELLAVVLTTERPLHFTRAAAAMEDEAFAQKLTRLQKAE
ncbi:MAG: homogentisate 1,2-dioxygenase [Chthonomonadales bacterium]